MFNDEEPIVFRKMHDFSPVDGFVEVTENLADMIKFVANEPSVGLFYVQQHTHNAAPNLINLKNSVVEKSHETALHTEDLEDSITMVRSMKECGFPIADDMIGEIKKSLSIMSSKQPKKGLLSNSSAGFLGRTSSWSPATWGRNAIYSEPDGGKNSGYLSSVFMSAKQRTNSFKWPQTESRDTSQSNVEELPYDPSPASSSAVDNPSSSILDAENEDLPLSNEIDRKLQEDSQISRSLPHQQFLTLYENYDEFKADREAKLEQWLDDTDNEEDSRGKESNRGDSTQ